MINKDVSYFNQAAFNYDSDSQKVKRAEMFAAAIRSEVTITSDFVGLDYGCGTGLTSFFLQSCMGKIILADNSPGMLAVLQEKIKVASIKNMFPQQLDLAKGETLGQRFNIVYSLMAMHHVLDIKNIFKTFYSLLTNHGILCIGDLDKEDGTFHGRDFAGHNGFDWNELTKIATLAGFKNIRFKNFFNFEKNITAAEKRKYPLFLMVAEKL